MDEINLGSQAVLQCIEKALDSEIISMEIPELIEWKKGFLSNAIENGGVVIFDALDQTSSVVSERLNRLLDSKHDETEKAKFDVFEKGN